MKSRKQACICFAVLWPLSVTISILHMYKHIVLYFLWCLLAENTLLLGGHCMGFGIQFWKWWTFEFTGPPPHTNSLLNQWSAVPEFIIHTGEKPKHVQHVRSLSPTVGTLCYTSWSSVVKRALCVRSVGRHSLGRPVGREMWDCTVVRNFSTIIVVGVSLWNMIWKDRLKDYM